MVLGLITAKMHNEFSGISTANFCYLTNETRLLFNSALRFIFVFFLVWTGSRLSFKIVFLGNTTYN